LNARIKSQGSYLDSVANYLILPRKLSFKMADEAAQPSLQPEPPPSTEPFASAPDAIFITNVGVGRRADTWYWLMLGFHVYDEQFSELTLERLEREVDPNQVMNPILLRGEIWKTVAPHFWQVDDGGVARHAPSQPGLTLQLQGIHKRICLPWQSLDANAIQRNIVSIVAIYLSEITTLRARGREIQPHSQLHLVWSSHLTKF
jgi:hypothetical protein